MVIKCKNCGGDILFTPGDTYGTCEFCNSVNTIPRGDDEQKLNLYNRANHFRRQGEFDKALAAYEKLLEQDDTDAEAHWGAALSRYGIEYVEDPAIKKRVPTCHRLQLASILARQGLSCLEFASGIPGCIGGLVYMNAGAYRSEMANVIRRVLVLKDDDFVWMEKEEMNFSYRHSVFHDHPHWVILAAELKLERKPVEEIEELMADRLKRRKETQPLDKPSAGSCFRNPEDGYAWKLIDGIGYRGYQIHDVSVSDKHSNFIINNGNGSAEDYLQIAYEIQDKVKEKYDIRLVMEVEKFNC